MAHIRKRGKRYHCQYTDADGNRVTRAGCSEKRPTEDMARAAEKEVAEVRRGLVDAKGLALAAHARRPLAEHLDAWEADMRAKGDTPKHARQFAGRARRLV